MDLAEREVAEDEADRCGLLHFLDLAICGAGVRTLVVAVLDDQRPAGAAEVIELIDLEHLPDDVTRVQHGPFTTYGARGFRPGRSGVTSRISGSRPTAAIHVDDLKRRLTVEQQAVVGGGAVAFAGGVEPAFALAGLLQLRLDLGQLALREAAYI